jgi:hypothetical protein
MEWLGGVMRVRFGESSWTDVSAEELAFLVGHAYLGGRPNLSDGVTGPGRMGARPFW